MQTFLTLSVWLWQESSCPTETWGLPADQGRGWRGLKQLDLRADTAPKWLNVLQISGNLPMLEFIPNKSIKSTILMNILYRYDTVRPI